MGKGFNNKVVGYVRCSTLEQSETGDSIQTQIDSIETYCIQKGLHLVGIIKDAGVSGGKLLAERLGGQELIKTLESKQVSGVVFSKLDRGFRNSGDAILTIDKWVKRGMDVHIVNWHGGSTLDTRDPMAKLQLGMISVFADFERSMISARTRETLRAKKKRGEVYSPTPLGYVAEAGKLVADAAEQATIALIKELKAAGRSLRQIAAELTSGGHKTKKGGSWYASTIKAILDNNIHVTTVPA